MQHIQSPVIRIRQIKLRNNPKTKALTSALTLSTEIHCRTPSVEKEKENKEVALFCFFQLCLTWSNAPSTAHILHLATYQKLGLLSEFSYDQVSSAFSF